MILVSSIYEVAAAALGFRGALGSINSITAAVVSSLMAAIAIAEHMRREHQGRLDAQAELQHTYDVSPVGLFTLASDGRFLKTNPALVAMLLGSAAVTAGVIGVGDDRVGKFLAGHQSKQDASTLRQVAIRLGGEFHNGNKRQVPSDVLDQLPALPDPSGQGEVEGRPHQRAHRRGRGWHCRRASR